MAPRRPPRVSPARASPGLGAAAAAAIGAPVYPLTITGRLDPTLSRGLWLVKWLLAIPHYIVLFFLWIAFAVVTFIAFFAILFTGRYPKGMFDFNVGVLRWSWRVGYYSFSALGTDRYPPFTLGAVDYPATLDVAHPDHLSRGLVLVKWWLLAIPHYLVLALIGSGWWMGWWGRGEGRWMYRGGFGLIGLLVLFAGVSLLFRGRYPSGLFAFTMGLNRWLYRVVAYVTLMTDTYPPFRLDQGGAGADRRASPVGRPVRRRARDAHRSADHELNTASRAGAPSTSTWPSSTSLTRWASTLRAAAGCSSSGTAT